MKEIFVSLEIAKELKTIGFDKPCLMGYDGDNFFIDNPNRTSYSLSFEDGDIEFWDFNHLIKNIETDTLDKQTIEHLSNNVSIPTYEQVFKWFREKDFWFDIYNDCDEKYHKFTIYETKKIKHIVSKNFKTYEKSREELILKMIEIYKKTL